MIPSPAKSVPLLGLPRFLPANVGYSWRKRLANWRIPSLIFPRWPHLLFGASPASLSRAVPPASGAPADRAYEITRAHLRSNGAQIFGRLRSRILLPSAVALVVFVEAHRVRLDSGPANDEGSAALFAVVLGSIVRLTGADLQVWPRQTVAQSRLGFWPK